MRVLQVYRTYFPDPPGGGQEAMRQIAQGVKALGIETRIMALSPHPEPKEIPFPEGIVVRTRSIAAPASCDIGDVSAVRLFRHEAAQADVVHFHFPWPFADLLRFALPSGKPTLMTYHSDIVRQKWLGRLYAPLMKYTLCSIDAVVATSPNYVATSPVLSNLKPERLHVIPLGVSDKTAEPRNETILSWLGLQEGKYILSLSVLRYYKGLHTLVMAAPHIPFPVVIAGSGLEEDNLRQLAAQVGATNIIFAGQVSEPEKWALLASCRALAFPSHLRSEAFGLSLVEAQMFGRPVISCAIGTGTSYVNENGVTGIEIPPEDFAALAEALTKLCDDAALAAQMGKAGHARYQRLFSGGATARGYAELYKRLASPRSFYMSHRGTEASL